MVRISPRPDKQLRLFLTIFPLFLFQGHSAYIIVKFSYTIGQNIWAQFLSLRRMLKFWEAVSSENME